ncbi:dnaJ-like protein 60 isoform X2 [Dermacentor andersoni]|uniref:dnaJ-like protein 60 isoform X2 n=1 Tax=Dermacentor andersoni TaxID=34620 RepID=UPI002417236C|nr:dnaJ-like protein 60 [Dermacentor andersoni]
MDGARAGPPSFFTSTTGDAQGHAEHLSKTYYEVLGVKNDCTQKEIRDAYVKLCKQLHPDVKGAATSIKDHSKFTELNQAYTILSKPLDRKHYDDTLLHPELHNVQRTVWRPYTRYEEPFMHTKGSSGYDDYETPGYEDFAHLYKEKRRQHQNAKVYIVTGCLVLIVCGACLHYVAFRYGTSNEMKRKMQETNRKNWAEYHQSKSDFRKYGMEGQMERLLGFKRETKEDKVDKSSED